MYPGSPAAFRQNASIFSRARVRPILVAVALSVLGHALLMSGAATGPAGRRSVQATNETLEVTLSRAQPAELERESDDARRAETTVAGARAPALRQYPIANSPAAQPAEAQRDALRSRGTALRADSIANKRPAGFADRSASLAHPAVAARSDAGIPGAHAPDTTYYTIRQIDIYPVPAEPLQLTHLAHVLPADGSARALVELHISETGVVEAAKVIEAHPSGRFEGELASTFLAARFAPAMRDGRAVRSRVVVRVE